jgi:hypothetical protein
MLTSMYNSWFSLCFTPQENGARSIVVNKYVYKSTLSGSSLIIMTSMVMARYIIIYFKGNFDLNG